jgi:hypothetical protein
VASLNRGSRGAGRAVAELATIVLGVLLALGVDQAVDDREGRNLERSYLERLSEELRSDIEGAERDLWRFGFQMASAEAIYPLTLSPSIPLTDSIGFGVEAIIAGFHNWTPVEDATFEELKSTGRLTLIRNVAVRRAIVSYYRSMERGHAFIDNAELSYRYLSQRLGGADAHWLAFQCYAARLDAGSGQPFDCHPEIPVPVVARIVTNMRGNDEVLGALGQRVYELELMLRLLRSRLDETRQLLELVDEEQGGA